MERNVSVNIAEFEANLFHLHIYISTLHSYARFLHPPRRNVALTIYNTPTPRPINLVTCPRYISDVSP